MIYLQWAWNGSIRVVLETLMRLQKCFVSGLSQISKAFAFRLSMKRAASAATPRSASM